MDSLSKTGAHRTTERCADFICTLALETRRAGKKIASDVDNSPLYSEKRYQMICQIKKFLSESCSYREIARRMGVVTNTIAKYLHLQIKLE